MQKLKKTDVASLSLPLELLLWTREEPMTLYFCEWGVQDLRLRNVDVCVAHNRMYDVGVESASQVRSIDAGSVVCLARDRHTRQQICL